MPTVLRRFSDTKAVPWRNGLGRTWPLIERVPWQLSVARLTEPAAFSVFPGLHRTFMPWGGGVRLEIDGDAQDIHHGETSRFAGAATTRLVALDHPCHAVNLMASTGQPTLAVAAPGARFPDAAIVLLTAPTADTARFDVIRLDAGEPLPAEGVVVRDAGG